MVEGQGSLVCKCEYNSTSGISLVTDMAIVSLQVQVQVFPVHPNSYSTSPCTPTPEKSTTHMHFPISSHNHHGLSDRIIKTQAKNYRRRNHQKTQHPHRNAHTSDLVFDNLDQ